MTSDNLQQNALPITTQPRGEGFRDWYDGLWDCTNDWSSCLWVTFCPLCYAARLYHQYNECSFGSLCCPSPVVALRAFHRGRERIAGSITEDNLVGTCLCYCALCQIGRDIKFIENTRGYLDV
ncbi:unnamed protein product [Calicophoron daubneyi]|uniref:Cornifelin n=1 Tax=Calicophoron daubneyi TaxID=300641 RepID=A0AAV2TUA7_CALDB